ncbi:MAG TPA: hypothetical protein VMR62_09535 [Bryobacteraceae bacterium]|jgi:hypothetical protein|nr:hypothetical protein [Bryobacteraceae bacterium]
MIRGYLETSVMNALLTVRLIDEMQKWPAVDIDEFADGVIGNRQAARPVPGFRLRQGTMTKSGYS